MVVDTLDNLEKYVSLNPLFADVVKFIKENDLSKLEDGKHFIKESNLFVNITTANGKSEEDAVLETHRKILIFRFLLTTRRLMAILLLLIFLKWNITRLRM